MVEDDFDSFTNILDSVSGMSTSVTNAGSASSSRLRRRTRCAMPPRNLPSGSSCVPLPGHSWSWESG